MEINATFPLEAARHCRSFSTNSGDQLHRLRYFNKIEQPTAELLRFNHLLSSAIMKLVESGFTPRGRNSVHVCVLPIRGRDLSPETKFKWRPLTAYFTRPPPGPIHWRIYHWATWAMPPPLWAVDRKCSKLKISHTAVIAARVVKQRRQRDSV